MNQRTQQPKADNRVKRITVCVPLMVANELARRANLERRSLSSYAGIELEKAVKTLEPMTA